MDLEFVAALVFYATLAVLAVVFRRKLKPIWKIGFTYEIKKGLKFINKLSKYKKLWLILSTISIPVGFFFIVSIGYNLVQSIVLTLQGEPTRAVGLLLPGVKIPGMPYVPLLQGIISIIVLMIVHELAHGVLAKVHGLRVKSFGIGLVAFLPIALTEISERSLKKLHPISRMRIESIGPFANICLALLLFLLLMPLNSILAPHVHTYVEITEVREPASAYLKVGDRILSLNGHPISTLEDFKSAFESLKPGETVNITTQRGQFQITLGERDGKPHLGVTIVQRAELTSHVPTIELLYWFTSLISWIATINLLVGIANYLPIFGIDGGRMVFDFFNLFLPEGKALKATSLISSLYLTLIVMNFIVPIL